MNGRGGGGGGGEGTSTLSGGSNYAMFCLLSPLSKGGQLLKERICSMGAKLCAKCHRQSLKMILLKL